MKKSILFFAVLIGLASCGSNSTTSNAQNPAYVTQSPQQQQTQAVQVQGTPDLVGFDIPQFNALLKTTKDPEALTQALNSQPNSINTLDLNGDGNADYLIVNQVGNNLQVVDQVSANPSDNVVVATLNVTNNNGSGSYQIIGSPQYSGANYQYQSPQGLSFGQLLFLSWWISPYHYNHPYRSSYRYGYYPSYYHPYHCPRPYNRAYITTHTTTRTVTRPGTSTTVAKTPAKVQTPVQTPKPVQSVSAPTKSQAQFKDNAGTNYKAPTTNAFKPTPAPQRSAPQQQTRQVSAPSRPPSRPTSSGGRRR